MKIRVRIFGALCKRFLGPYSKEGIEVEIPDDATSEDLLSYLEISKSQMAVVLLDGRILNANHKLQEGSSVHIIQAVFGG